MGALLVSVDSSLAHKIERHGSSHLPCSSEGCNSKIFDSKMDLAGSLIVKILNVFIHLPDLLQKK